MKDIDPQDNHGSKICCSAKGPRFKGRRCDLSQEQRNEVWKYLKQRHTRSSEGAHAMMELGSSSVAGLAMAPLQDLLNLGGEDRMNVPGRAEGNWCWRATQEMEEMLSDPAFEWLGGLTKNANRLNPLNFGEYANSGGRIEKLETIGLTPE